MIPKGPVIGLRFDSTKAYGSDCWAIFWRAIDPETIKNVQLYEGDSAASLTRKESVFIIAVQGSDNSAISRIKNALSASQEFENVAAQPMFVEGQYCLAEPLPEAGRIDSAGNLVGEAGGSRSGLGRVRREREASADRSIDAPPTMKPKGPASKRTMDLPNVLTLKELEKVLKDRFSQPRGGYWYYLTPDELCDVVERYEDVFQAHWKQGSCGLSEDMVYLNLFQKGSSGENLEFIGLFAYPSVQDAQNDCAHEKMDPRALGLRGKIVQNFKPTISNYANDDWYEKYYAPGRLDAAALREKIAARRAQFGISESPIAVKKWWQFWK